MVRSMAGVYIKSIAWCLGAFFAAFVILWTSRIPGLGFLEYVGAPIALVALGTGMLIVVLQSAKNVRSLLVGDAEEPGRGDEDDSGPNGPTAR